MDNDLRKIYILKRKKLSDKFVIEAGEGIRSNSINSGKMSFSAYMSYMPINNEASVDSLNNYLIENKKELCFPVTNQDYFLTPFKFTDKDNMRLGKYNIREPHNSIEFAVDKIDVVLVPGVIFDIYGGRIGYGKGCYDRFLENTNMLKIGICYEFQLRKEKLCLKETDIKMDYIITEASYFEVLK